MDKVKVALIGLGFGAEFIPIYQRHPNAELWAICQRSEDSLNEIGDEFGVERRFTDYEELLQEDELDAVHINTPIGAHAPMSLAALEAGKHAACTVPMATTTEECLQIVEAERKSGKVYMMMETAVYTREFLYVQELYASGKLGKIQFLRGAHQQNMGLPGWPDYWKGFPPMHYATHAVSPLLRLADARAKSIVCFGSGRIREEYIEQYGSPFAVETALVDLEDSDLACEVTRSLYDTIRQYVESFDVYGSELSFEWEQTIDEGHVLFSGYEDAERVEVLAVVVEIRADGRHGQRVAAELLEVVGDIAGGAAEIAMQFGHQKGDVEHMRLFRKDVILEPLRKYHDVVVRD